MRPEILEGQVDKFYSTMGVMRFSKKLNQLVYTYSYRNQYLLLDTALNLKFKANTIDPVAHAQIKPIEIDEGISTLASTASIVNINSQVYENLLFVQSNLKASNETIKAFDMSTVIDVYDIKERRYLFSFYLPDYKSIKMNDFLVRENLIVSKYNQFFVTYSFDVRNMVL